MRRTEEGGAPACAARYAGGAADGATGQATSAPDAPEGKTMGTLTTRGASPGSLQQ
jgi:hypothetical protein